MLLSMDDFLSSDVAVWCTTFWSNERRIQLEDFADGIFLNQVFCEIADYDWTSVEPLLSNASVNNCVQNWKLLIKNLEEFFIDKLHQLIIAPPPSIFHIVYSPSSLAAKIELRRATLLLLFAAISCEKRELYIRSIMENLSTDVQNGIMQSITGFTECPDSAVNLTGTCELTHELRHGLIKALVSRVDLHFQLAEEVIRRVSDQHRERTPKKGALLTLQQEQHLNKKFPVNLSRSRSLASSLELIGCAFRRTIEDREQMQNHPMGVDADTMTNSETGYESRPPTDEALKDRSELLDSRDLDTLLVFLETQSFIDTDEKKHIVAQIDKTKAKLRQQGILISEQADQLEEMQMQLTEARSEADQLRVERMRLADAATAARHWQDEADAGQLAIAQLRDAERTCEKLKQRLEAAQFYKVRCQELSVEVDVLIKERDDLESRLSEQQERQSKAQLLDRKLTEKSKRLLDLELQRERDLEEICRLKNELMEARIDALNLSRKQSSLRSTSPIHSDCEDNNIICPIVQREHPMSAREHPYLDKLSPIHGKSQKTVMEKQEELEIAVARCASHLRGIRAKLDASRGKTSSDLSSPNSGRLSDAANSSIGERVDAFMEDLEQVIRDVIGAVKENDLKVAALAKANFSNPTTSQTATQTDPLQYQMDEKTFSQSSAFLKKIMQSAQSTFQDSVDSLRDILTDAMLCELRGNVNSAKDLNRRPVPRRETHCQTSPELHTVTTSGEVQRSYRICNQFGTPLQLGIVQPNRIQRSVSICNGVRDARPKVFSHKGVNTTPIVDSSQVSVKEAAHEALLQATEAKKLLATVCQENNETKDRAEAIKHELDHCKAFLEVYEKRNAYLEKENRAVLLQLRSLLSQNQDVFMEALESSECHYREKLALHDELAVLKRHKERLEERIVGQCGRLPSPKKVKPGLRILQKAREALMKVILYSHYV
uniref:HOOK_N domain-containing protein n=1 Tax=Mesocestoides corti TaxID=53468 RepID=A0A5K3F2R7_MESCO